MHQTSYLANETQTVCKEKKQQHLKMYLDFIWTRHKKWKGFKCVSWNFPELSVMSHLPSSFPLCRPYGPITSSPSCMSLAISHSIHSTYCTVCGVQWSHIQAKCMCCHMASATCMNKRWTKHLRNLKPITWFQKSWEAWLATLQSQWRQDKDNILIVWSYQLHWFLEIYAVAA